MTRRELITSDGMRKAVLFFERDLSRFSTTSAAVILIRMEMTFFRRIVEYKSDRDAMSEGYKSVRSNLF